MSARTVSVVVPCRDAGRFLEDAADSVFAQTHEAVELIVVDDGSTDAFTRRVLAGFDWPRTTVIRQDARHAAAARNLALRSARGAYICCLEAGDRLEPTYLQKAVEALEKAPACDFAAAGWRTLGSLDVEVRPEDCGVIDLLAALPHPAGVTRIEAVRDAAGFDETLADGGADHDLWLRRVAAGHAGLLLPEPLLFQRAGGRLPLGLLRRHADLYRRHAAEVFAKREMLVDALWSADRRPADAPWPEERRRLEQAQRRIAELEAAIADAHYQVAHFRGSLSWRLTEPVRALLRWLRRERPGASAPMPPSPSARAQ